MNTSNNKPKNEGNENLDKNIKTDENKVNGEIESLKKEKEELKLKIDKLIRQIANQSNDYKLQLKLNEEKLMRKISNILKNSLSQYNEIMRAISYLKKSEKENEKKSLIMLLETILDKVQLIVNQNGGKILQPKEKDSFNGQEHTVLSQVEGEGEKNTIKEVVSYGLIFNNKIIQPAQVIVYS